MPQSPPETNVKVSVAFAGMVRNLTTGESLPIWKTYSVPGETGQFAPVNLEAGLRKLREVILPDLHVCPRSAA